mmetsp:Transcript_11153/g.16929  ORF Transcript_11153/g.16929 Transcript_11153/m.16929 type:complete len:1074 (-) Transcript_11153:66-3287(-)
MGNQLKKDYDVNLDQQCGSGGMGLRWKLYNAVDLKTKEECTIFIFSKKDLPKSMKKESDRFLALLKKEVDRGYKFKHPNCLRVVKPVKEFRGELAFVTERVMCSLSNILGDTTRSLESTMTTLTSNNNTTNNDNSGDSFALPVALQNYKFGALQIRSGIAHLCDAVTFIHNDAHMAHGFIDASNVYVTESGDWKLFGFQFAEHVATEHDEAALGWDFTNDKELAFYPPFDCLAPEIMISNLLTVKSDVFSIGRLCYLLHRQQAGIRREKPMRAADEYRRFVNNLNLAQSHLSVGGGNERAIPYEGIPETFVDTLKKCLRTDEKLRCSVADIINCKYLNDMVVRVIRYLEKLLDKEEDGRIKFFKQLPQVIPMFDKPTLVHKVIPPLMTQLMDERMVKDVLPSLMRITAELEPAQYQSLIQPTLQKYFIASDLPEVFFVLLSNLLLLCSKSTVEARRDQLVPMILKGMGTKNVKIQVNVLKQIPVLVENQFIEWRDLKSKILPKLKEICALSVAASDNHRVTALRINVLMCLAKIFSKFDTDTIRVVVLHECAFTVLSRTKEAPILMSVLGVCDAIAKHVAPTIIAQDILPRIVPLLVVETLNEKQYKIFMKSVRYMIDKIDRFQVNAFQRKVENGATSNQQPQSAEQDGTMDAILEKEFDPKKTGEKHQKIDDPFAMQMGDLTSVSPTSAAAAIVDSTDGDDGYNPFGAEYDTAQQKTQPTAATSAADVDVNVVNAAFAGFTAALDTNVATKSATPTTLTPKVYGTNQPVLTSEKFGWSNESEVDSAFISHTSSNNSNNAATNLPAPSSVSSSTVKPFGGGSGGNQLQSATTTQSAASDRNKRRVRSKGKIIANSTVSPNPSGNAGGYPGFGGGAAFAGGAVAANTSQSPFGFMAQSENINQTNTSQSTSSMFTGVGFGDAMANNSNHVSSTSTAAAFGMFDNQSQQLQQQQQKPPPKGQQNDMFDGMKTHYGSGDDPFAGLGHMQKRGAAQTQSSTSNVQSGFDFMNSATQNNTQQSQSQSAFGIEINSGPNNNNMQPNLSLFGGSQLNNTGNQNNTNASKNNNDDPFAGFF